MNCFMCKGDLENKNTTFMVELNNCIIIIKNVPSQVCKQCGEVSYSNEVAKQLERLVNSVKNTITEITVINYTEKVLKNSKNPNELKEVFNKIEDNYNIKITRYNEELYKKGFIDGVNLILNCLEE